MPEFLPELVTAAGVPGALGLIWAWFAFQNRGKAKAEPEADIAPKIDALASEQHRHGEALGRIHDNVIEIKATLAARRS